MSSGTVLAGGRGEASRRAPRDIQHNNMSTAAQRRAWNDAMRSVGAVLPPSASVSGGIAGGSSIRRGRNKRREKARKSSGGRGGDGGGGTGGSSSLEEREYQVALHMDMLEGVVDKFDEDVDDDEYDEFAELDDNDGDEYEGKAKKKRKGTGGTSKKKSSSSSSSVPKYLKARSLASILIEEASRSDSMAKQYVDANVQRLGSGMTSTRRIFDAGGGGSNSIMTTVTKPYPHRKFCPVTGLVGEYTEPRTGIPYATLSALEQIRERPPPWMSTNNSGSANYWEAVKSIQNN